MSEPKTVRPPQATLAGWLVVGGSVVVVVMALGQGAVLHTLDTQEAVEEYLSSPPGDQLGLGVQGMLTLLRVVWTITAVSAAAAAVLGWYALHRSKGARLALSGLAVPLFLTSFFFIGLPGASALPAMVTAAIVMLWFQPARDWYDGITREAPAPPAPPAAPPTAPTGRDPLLDLPPPTTPPLHPAAYAVRPVTAVAERPSPLAWACVVAWVSTVTVFTAFGLTALQLAVAPGQLVDDVHRSYPELTMSDADLKLAVTAFCAVAMLWSAAAAGLAVLVWRRVAWASAALSVSAALACVTVLPLVPCVATIVLLQRAGSRAWLRR